jgi:hypothetical protein
MKKNMLSLALFLGLASFSVAQEISVNPKTHEISKRAKNSGSIIDMGFDESGQKFSISYFTKMKEDFFGDPKQLQFEIYNFDKDFNFKDIETPVIDLVKARSKYKGFSFKGETYESEGLTVGGMGQLVVKKKLTTYKWDWFAGRYYKTVKVLDKVKLKDENDNRMVAFNSMDFEKDDKQFLSIMATGGTVDPSNAGGMVYTFMILDFDLNVTKRIKVDVPYSVQPVGSIVEHEDGTFDYLYILQPIKPYKGTNGAASGMDCIMLQVDGQTLEIKKNYKFQAPAVDWRIREFHFEGDDVYFAGPITAQTKGYYNLMAKYTTKTFPNLCVGKFSKTKAEYLTVITAKDMIAKLQTPAGSKGKFVTSSFIKYDYFEVINGDLFLSGQNYLMKNSNTGLTEVKQDAVLMRLNSKGEFVSYFGMPYDKPLKNYAFLGKSGNKVHWFVFVSSKKDEYVKPIARMASIDLSANTIGAMTTMGTGDKISISTSTPLIRGPKGEFAAIFGTQGDRGTLYFGKIMLD